jgi:long-chain acyl-CoA synthetase
MAVIFKPYADSKGDELALIDDFGDRTWSDYNSRVNQLIGALREAGLKPGSAVALLSGNRREYYEALGAINHAGFIVVPVNWHFVAEEVRYMVEDSGAEALVADARFIDIAEACGDLPALKLKILIDGTPPPGFQDYDALLSKQSSEEPDNQVSGGIMFYTSGTTGRPKGVRNSALGSVGGPMDGMFELAQLVGAALGAPAGGRSLLCGPAYHSAQWAFSWMPFTAGSSIIMRHKFDPAETLELIDKYQITNSHMVPTQFVRLLKARDGGDLSDNFDGSSLDIIWHGAAPCSPMIKKQMIEWWGPKITEYYGGTEGGILCTINSEEWLERPSSVGKPDPAQYKIEIIDDDGNPCATGTAGTIYQINLSGADFEYHNKPEETAKRHRGNANLTLGDIGYLDDAGYLYLTDRKIDMIISGGVNIYPAEIESVLVAHPAVKDVAVFGVPNDEFGEEIKAVIELIDASKAGDETTADLAAFAQEHLAKYKVPRSFDYSQDMPRTPAGKLLKRFLRDPYWEGQDRSI